MSAQRSSPRLGFGVFRRRKAAEAGAAEPLGAADLATRRSMLGGSLLGLTGIAGFFGLRGAGAAPAANPGESLSLEGSGWTMGARGADGSRTARGELLLNGEPAGAFFGRSLAPGEAAGSELHTFSLADGTILGMGAAAADPEAESAYAIVGGTGRYSGATGSYVLRQSPVEMGGDGTASVTMTLNQGRVERGD